MKKVQLQAAEVKSSQVAEAFKTLRANLQFCGPKYHVIMITSCVPNDGKTTVSYEIASSYATDGKRVLLLDADLRKSVMAERLINEKCSEGTTEVLSGILPFSDCVCQTQNPNLDILFAGSNSPNPAELLGSEDFTNLISKVRESYDIVIVDTPPLGTVIDAAVVAKVCDGSVLIICSDKISRYFALEVLDQLRKSGCPVLGTVLNRVDMRKENYRKYGGRYYKRYYKKYGYGYGYGNYGYGYGYYGYGTYGNYSNTPQSAAGKKKK